MATLLPQPLTMLGSLVYASKVGLKSYVGSTFLKSEPNFYPLLFGVWEFSLFDPPIFPIVEQALINTAVSCTKHLCSGALGPRAWVPDREHRGTATVLTSIWTNGCRDETWLTLPSAFCIRKTHWVSAPFWYKKKMTILFI